MTSETTPVATSEHVAHYEALRTYVTDRHAAAARQGLAVVLRQGVAAWMDAWPTLPALPRPLPLPPPKNQCPSPLPDSARLEVVRVLAAMALGTIQEVHA